MSTNPTPKPLRTRGIKPPAPLLDPVEARERLRLKGLAPEDKQAALLILWRKAAKDALFDLSSGGADTTSDDPAIIAQGLKEATRLATETAAQVEMLCRLIGISSDPTSDWVETAARAVTRLETNAAEGVRGPLLLELDRLKAQGVLLETQAAEAQNQLAMAQIGFRNAVETENTAARVIVWCVSGLVGLISFLLGMGAGAWLMGGRS